MKKIFIILAFITVASCTKTDMGEIILGKENISLTVNGEEICAYKEATDQLYHNKQTFDYCVFDDKFSSWFRLDCQNEPRTEGQTITADLKWKSGGKTSSYEDLNFEVRKVTSDKKLWLWCAEKNIGIIVKNL